MTMTNERNEGQLYQAALNLVSVSGLPEAMDGIADSSLPETLAETVKTHAKIAVGSAFIPLPGADLVAAGANIWTMYARINKELDLPFAENVIQSIAAGAVTNLGGAVIGYMVVGSALKMLPGLGSVGGAAIASATIYGVTIASGIIYMNALKKLFESKKVGQISDQDLKVAMDELLEDKESIKQIYNTAKSSYSPS